MQGHSAEGKSRVAQEARECQRLGWKCPQGVSEGLGPSLMWLPEKDSFYLCEQKEFLMGQA
jgi:hypothetical protein